ncbi:hypothetical protein J2T17_006172 [Paenibacillus mucilaginosus]|uniref:HEAT repeat domain-containing protein n=1 Tax=Paenibacillus mucilaginosus TaxID=61624 RepID=UPI003D216625
MSIQVLTELHEEVRRLFIAGSGMASGDLRLRALQPRLEKLADAAPVLGRLAEGVQALVESDADSSPGRLLELGTLLHAVMYTQGRTDTQGELVEAGADIPAGTTHVPYRKLKPLIDALTERGPGRLEIIRSALEEGLFGDIRTHRPAVIALEDSYAETAEFVQERVLPAIGARAVPLLLQELNLQGGKADGRRLLAIHRLRGPGDPSLYLTALAEGAAELQVAAASILGDYEDQEAALLEASRSRRKELREAALLALSRIPSTKAADRLMECLASEKDAPLAVEPLRLSQNPALTARVLSHAEGLLAEFGGAEKPEAGLIARMAAAVSSLGTKREEDVFSFLQKLLASPHFMKRETGEIQEEAAGLLLESGDPQALGFVESLHGEWNHRLISFALRAALRRLPPEAVYERYAPYVKEKKTAAAKELLQTIRRLTTGLSRIGDGAREAREAQPWDDRWLPLFIRLDEEELVCRFVPEAPEPEAAAYVLAKLDAQGGRRGNNPAPLLTALFRMDEALASERLLHVIEQRTLAGSWWYIEYDLQRLLQELPASFADRLERLAGQAKNEGIRRALEEAALVARNKEHGSKGEADKGEGIES